MLYWKNADSISTQKHPGIMRAEGLINISDRTWMHQKHPTRRRSAGERMSKAAEMQPNIWAKTRELVLFVCQITLGYECNVVDKERRAVTSVMLGSALSITESLHAREETEVKCSIYSHVLVLCISFLFLIGFTNICGFCLHKQRTLSERVELLRGCSAIKQNKPFYSHSFYTTV